MCRFTYPLFYLRRFDWCKLKLFIYNNHSVYFVLSSSSFSGKAKSVQAICTNVSTCRYWSWLYSRLRRSSMFSLISHAQSHLYMLLLVRDPQLSQVQRHQFSVEKKRGELNSQTFSKRTEHQNNVKIMSITLTNFSPIFVAGFKNPGSGYS